MTPAPRPRIRHSSHQGHSSTVPSMPASSGVAPSARGLPVDCSVAPQYVAPAKRSRRWTTSSRTKARAPCWAVRSRTSIGFKGSRSDFGVLPLELDEAGAGLRAVFGEDIEREERRIDEARAAGAARPVVAASASAEVAGAAAAAERAEEGVAESVAVAALHR